MPSQLALVLVALLAGSDLPDSDGDGLSDFHEVHKHLTDPAKADSDGDGIPDGEWGERHEYAYTVRSVVQVMRPVTPAFLTDDYQDARVLDETSDFVELEVRHYPLASMKRAPGHATPPGDLARWLEPGPSSDASEALGEAIRAAMATDGLEPADVSTGRGVVAAAQWLLNRAESHQGFTSFVTGFDDQGRPFVPKALRGGAEQNANQAGHTLEEQWRYEVLASGMFASRRRGSCTSSAIYLSGCLRSLGVPTRTVLCIPIIDASDESEWRLMDLGIEHAGVRRVIRDALAGGRNAWTSHTFNEVYVDGRWRRLNYATLDQGILDSHYLGLMTHVATLHDWADARFWETVGRRQKSDTGPDVFGFRNPYSTLSLRDEIGEHCDAAKLELPMIAAGDTELEIVALQWSDDPELHNTVREWHLKRDAFGLVAEIPVSSMEALQSFARRSDQKIYLRNGSQTLGLGLNPGCCWVMGDTAYVTIPVSDRMREHIRLNEAYRVEPRNESPEARWRTDLTVVRTRD